MTTCPKRLGLIAIKNAKNKKPILVKIQTPSTAKKLLPDNIIIIGLSVLEENGVIVLFSWKIIILIDRYNI